MRAPARAHDNQVDTRSFRCVRDGFTNIVAGNYHRLPTQTRKLRRIDSLKERLLK